MRRISAANATPGKLFKDADPSTGGRATSFNAAWANDVQESIMTVIEARGGGESANAFDLYRAIVDIAHPVTSYLILEGEDSPAVAWNWTTWVEVQGRMLVGLDEGQTEFNLVGKQGGAKSVNLSIPRDGWGVIQNGDTLPEPSTAGRLVTGSGRSENSEDLESLAHALNTPQVAVATLPPHRVVRMWQRIA